MIERIDHVNFVVADMAAAIAFYRDLLGMRLSKQATISGGWIDKVTGLADVVADVAFLEAPSGPSIELLRYRSPEGARPAGLGQPNTLGLRHIAFRVTDLDGLVASMQAAGVTFFAPPQQVPAVQVDYIDQRKRLAYCRDPEGNLLELCEYT
jgi:catechol 2,3-dioxygenase-like lactoylglutathione lyase family enzyme